MSNRTDRTNLPRNEYRNKLERARLVRSTSELLIGCTCYSVSCAVERESTCLNPSAQIHFVRFTHLTTGSSTSSPYSE
ncbi:hypothetical protein Y032_0129g1501 [Ancylostoma ceylanicum]|uniref:Uncharacterized protein n=1 Tax=Ancylostoma ceylanicum TaxID=53326 RepID=A0A016T7H1_9BILA|nr:hypothetical protein Y032_0129g1501 [Ancylostoma ceylanicum]